MALPAAACAGDLSALDPAGPAADAIALLWWIMFAGGGIILLLVFAVLAVALGKAHRRRLQPMPLIVWGGVVLPSIGIVALVTAAFILGERLLPRVAGAEPLRVEVTARQFSWSFAYPDEAVTENVLHIPVGREVDFIVTSEDVIHSFWIPSLGGKIDAIPGHRNVVRLRADRPGRYGGICTEFCGTGHSDMRFIVEAHEADAYEAALAAASRTGERAP